MHPHVNKPFPQPPLADEGGQVDRDQENSKDALANRELDAQTTLARPSAEQGNA